MKGSTSLLLALTSAANAVKYGYNHATVNKDPEIVAQNFMDVENIDLNSPFFLDPDSRLPGFSEGTQGPSSLETVGMQPSPHMSPIDASGIPLTRFQRTSSRTWPTAMVT